MTTPSSRARRSFVGACGAALALILLGSCRSGPTARTDRAPAPHSSPSRAPVVLAIVVDQLSSWVADERIPLLPADGFFARLARDGTWVHAMRYPYAQTDTACGHASLHTGRTPAETGITLNEVPEGGGHRSVFRDVSTRLVGPHGPLDRAGSSARQLLVPTVSDRLHDARPDARIISVSLKDRAALLPAGKHPTHAIWFEAELGTFVTSTAVEPTLPSWAIAHGDSDAVAEAEHVVWRPLDPAWLAMNAGRDDAPGEGDLDGLGTVFPHVVRTGAAFRASPMSDSMILDIALAGIVTEHDPSSPMLVTLSMSASDLIGHTFGPSSWEAWDQLRRLDASLAEFLRAVEAKLGPVSIVLSADHGNVMMPEARREQRGTVTGAGAPAGGIRLAAGPAMSSLRKALERELGPGEWVDGFSDGYVFLGRDGRALRGGRREALDRLVHRTLERALEGGTVFDTRELERRCPSILERARGIPDRAAPGEPIETLVCRSFHPHAGGGDYYVVPGPGSFFEGDLPGRGSGHGTPYLYDRTVPLFVLPARARAGAGTAISDAVDFSAYAELEAALLGLDDRSVAAIVDAKRAR